MFKLIFVLTVIPLTLFGENRNIILNDGNILEITKLSFRNGKIVLKTTSGQNNITFDKINKRYLTESEIKRVNKTIKSHVDRISFYHKKKEYYKTYRYLVKYTYIKKLMDEYKDEPWLADYKVILADIKVIKKAYKKEKVKVLALAKAKAKVEYKKKKELAKAKKEAKFVKQDKLYAKHGWSRSMGDAINKVLSDYNLKASSYRSYASGLPTEKGVQLLNVKVSCTAVTKGGFHRTGEVGFLIKIIDKRYYRYQYTGPLRFQ